MRLPSNRSRLQKAAGFVRRTLAAAPPRIARGRALEARHRPRRALWILHRSGALDGAPPREGWCPVVRYDAASFTAGEYTATRVASCVARLAARDLMEGARWWNRWRRGAMSSALIACAEELERDADLRAAAEEAR